jgi:hypothetical protein
MKTMIGTYVIGYFLRLFLFCDSAENLIFSAADRAEIVRSVKIQSGTGCVFYVELWDQRLRGEFRKVRKVNRFQMCFLKWQSNLHTSYLSTYKKVL